jgi:hypothetical protein
MIRASAALSSPDAVGGALGLRERLLEMAGVTEAEQAILTRRAIDTYVSHLSAKKVQRLVVNAGLNTSVVKEFIDDDGALQARAADALLDHFGVVISKASAGGTQVGTLIVNITKREPPPLPITVDAQVVDITDL